MSVISLQQYAYRQAAAEAGVDGRRQQLQAVAEQFEAIFLQQILKQMRKAGEVFKSDDSMRRREMDLMYDFYDQALADALARKRQLGIADMLVRQLGGEEGGEGAGAMESGGAGEEIPLEFEALVESVIRQESGGDPAAVSPKGARGLMQLMPATAREMAEELGLVYDEARLTTDAEYNRRLGSAYLAKMLSRYDNHPALALAAYNAGPARVDDWLARNGDPRDGSIGTDSWVERIPFQETRLYTRRILDEVGRLQVAELPQRPAPESKAAAELPLPFGMTDALVAVELPAPFGSEEQVPASMAQPAAQSMARPMAELPPPFAELPLNYRKDSVALSDRAPSAAVQHASKAFAQPVRLQRNN